MKKLIGFLFLMTFLFACDGNTHSSKSEVSTFHYTYKKPKEYTPTFDRSLRKKKSPRQRILVAGNVKEGFAKKYTISEFESLPFMKTITYFDPYDNNKKVQFTGVYLKDFVKHFANDDYKSIEISAIDGFKVDMPREFVDDYNFFIAWKNEEGYLTVDTMGPARIVEAIEGIYPAQYKLKTSTFLVWQVSELIFKK